MILSGKSYLALAHDVCKWILGHFLCSQDASNLAASDVLAMGDLIMSVIIIKGIFNFAAVLLCAVQWSAVARPASEAPGRVPAHLVK
jgi:hypothetical protein